MKAVRRRPRWGQTSLVCPDSCASHGVSRAQGRIASPPLAPVPQPVTLALSMAERIRKRWGDEDSDDEGLPPRQEFGPDEDGNRTVVEFHKNERGDVVKTTTRVRMVKEEKRIYQSVVERRKLPRFGEAARETDADMFTVQSKEDIPFERTNVQQKTEAEEQVEDIQQKLNAVSSKKEVVTNLKEMLARRRMERQLLQASGALMPELPPEEDSPGPMMGPGGTKFVPPHMRGGKSAAQLDLELKRQRDECGIRITNLSEETDVDDLKELCRPFGTVLRAHIATDKNTGESRGFGFVTFATKSQAQAAIDKLNGYGYDHLVLSVDWSNRDMQRPR